MAYSIIVKSLLSEFSFYSSYTQTNFRHVFLAHPVFWNGLLMLNWKDLFWIQTFFECKKGEQHYLDSGFWRKWKEKKCVKNLTSFVLELRYKTSATNIFKKIIHAISCYKCFSNINSSFLHNFMYILVFIILFSKMYYL